MVGMSQLGSCDNVTVKLSGGFATDPQWTQSSAVELVKDSVKLFTPRRYCIQLHDMSCHISDVTRTGVCLLATSQWIRLMVPTVNGLP